MSILHETLSLALTAAPWLVVGLLMAGLIRAFVSTDAIKRWMGGGGFWSVTRAAVMGAPLPLCSCGAIPTAVQLHRSGAGRGPATSFLIGTPGVGVDSLAITYALLGPFMVMARALGAVVTAIGTGLLVAGAPYGGRTNPVSSSPSCCGPGGVCGSRAIDCDDCDCGSSRSTRKRLADGMRYAYVDLLRDVGVWIAVGLVAAGALVAFVPPEAMASYGSGVLAMLLMSVVGIPLYICATAATPIAAGMLLTGVSPGTAFVFLLAGPITSFATLAVLRDEMGLPAVLRYLAGIVVSTVALGLLIDYTIGLTGISIIAQIGAVEEVLPMWIEWVSLIGLLVIALLPLSRTEAEPVAQ